MLSSTTLDTTVSCKERFNCQGAPYQNTKCCVLHLPSANKTPDFDKALKRKLDDRDFDFHGVWFPGKADFSEYSFTDKVNFQGATFNGEANFLYAKFEKPVSFNNAVFQQRATFGARFIEKADFSLTKFNEYADFMKVNFEKESIFFAAAFIARAKFEHATFNLATTFEKASFSGTVNFRLVTFGEAPANFRSVNFEENVTFDLAVFGGEASFYRTTFKKGVDFETTFKDKAHFFETEFGGRAQFTRVIFEKDTNFFGARFSSTSSFDEVHFKLRTNFDEAIFKERVSFNSAVFDEAANFRGVIFEDRVLFDSVTFNGQANFHLATFKDYVRFKGDEVFSWGSPPNFREVKFDHPKLVSFHSLDLRPFWFVEVDATEFALIDVKWNWSPIPIDQEIEQEKDEIIKHYEQYRQPRPGAPYSLLEIACWNLAVNAEENHRYEEASKFRYRAMESRRRSALIPEANSSGSLAQVSRVPTKRIQRVRRYWSSRVTLSNLYRLLSGYGENILRALVVLIGIWFLFGVIYAIILRDRAGVPLGWRAFPYSAAVITLQKPDPPPSPGIAQALVTLETILGPVQVALLALAIRRKFMR